MSDPRPLSRSAMTDHLTDPLIELLRAVDAGLVADRYHHTLGWATRRTDIHTAGTGGGLGLDVTIAALRLKTLELAEPADAAQRYGDRRWQITVTGRLVLANAAANRRGGDPR